MNVNGQCHCGMLSYELQLPVDGGVIPVRACGCAFCVKHGGVYTSHREAILDVTIRDDSLISRYCFGTETADFYVCARCGVVPIVTSMIEDHLYAVVNVNTFESIDRALFQHVTGQFDGEGLEARLARRARTWIPSVRMNSCATVLS